MTTNAVVLETLVDSDPATPGTCPTNISDRKVAHAIFKGFVKSYHRAESIDVHHVPTEGGALLVSNHSGGILSMDVPVIATALWDAQGIERDFRVLGHDVLQLGPIGVLLRRAGFMKANRENAAAALAQGAATAVFPGGDWDVCRPLSEANVISFGGRTGYVRTALLADVPIVPVVSIGGQEAQIILSRGTWVAKLFPRITKALRGQVAPISLGFPFGVAFVVPQAPLPSKIVTRFLEPIYPRAIFGPDPDPAEVDELIRNRMQTALDELAAARRFPIIG